MEVDFDAKINTPVLLDFKLQTLYKQPVTIIMTAIGCLMIYAFITLHSWYYPLIAAILILYPPIDMLRLSVMQAKMIPAYKNGMHYHVSAEGVTITVGEQTQTAEWNTFIKAAGTRSSYFLYTAKNAALIFPKESMGDKAEDVLRLISANMSPDKVKIRF